MKHVYAVRWICPTYPRSNDLSKQKIVAAIGPSIPVALEGARMWYGISFITGQDIQYGIMNKKNEFVCVEALQTPNCYSEEELNQILDSHYEKSGEIVEVFSAYPYT